MQSGWIKKINTYESRATAAILKTKFPDKFQEDAAPDEFGEEEDDVQVLSAAQLLSVRVDEA